MSCHNNIEHQVLNGSDPIPKEWLNLAQARELDDRKNLSRFTLCNDDLLYLVDHLYNSVGDSRIKTIADRILLSTLTTV